MREHLASRIVVGVGGSPCAEEATAFAVHLARALGGRATLACVLDPRCAAATRLDAEWMLEALVASHYDAHVPLTTRCIPAASPAAALRDLARRERATLLVVGASHIGAAGRALGGSTAERLAHDAPCPVVVVPSDWHRTFESAPRTVGVAFNGSAESGAALGLAVPLARAWPADVRLYSVFNADAYPIGLPFAPAVAMLRENLERDARERLAAATREVPGDVRAQGVLLLGSVPLEIAEHSKGLALLVVGSRGYGSLRSAIVGGVSRSLIRHASCPVMVVPRAAIAAASASTAAATAGLSPRPSEKSSPSMA